MSLRTILVHLDSSKRTPDRVVAAAALAREHEAHLIGLAPTGYMVPLVVADPGGVAGFVQAAMEALREEARAVTGRFNDQVRSLGVLSVESRVEEQDAATAMAVHARYSDLTVVSQVEPGRWVTTESPQLPQQVLLQSGRPVLVLPYAGLAPERIGRRVLAGWDGSRAAARALADALPLLRRAQDVHVAVFEAPTEVDVRHGDLPGADIGLWLARHGVKVEVERVPTTVPVGEAMLSHAADINADLIVAGGYGHSRLRETVLGGVTRTLLRSATVPVLMSH